MINLNGIDEWEKWRNWAIFDDNPSIYLNLIYDTGYISRYPEIANMKGCLQNPIWHPEIDCLLHTTYVCDEAVRISLRECLEDDDRLVLVFSALCHDMGKPYYSEGTFPDITSKNHARGGVRYAESFLNSIQAPQWLIDKVKPLVQEHMSYLSCSTLKAVRKLKERLKPATINELVWLIEADHSGRPPLPKGLPKKAIDMLTLYKQVEAEPQIKVNKPNQLIKGKDLVGLGLTPSPLFANIVRAAYAAQLNGDFNSLEGALQWVKENYC